MSTCYQVVSWTSLSGLVQLMVVGNKSGSVSGSQFGRGAIYRQFWWEVASSLFCASKPLFWLVGWWRGKIWCGGKPICGEGAIYCRFPVKVASSPSCAANPPGLLRVVFWLCRQGCCWLCRQVFWQCCQVFRKWVLVVAILAVWSRDSLGQWPFITEQPSRSGKRYVTFNFTATHADTPFFFSTHKVIP